MTSRKTSICVIGAGISGLSAAYCVALRHPGCDFTIYADKFSPNTTSNDGFGITSLRAMSEFDGPNTPEWTIATFERCRHLYEKSEKLAKEMGINKVEGMVLIDNKNMDENEFAMYDSPLLQLTASNVRRTSQKELAKEGFFDRTEELDAVFERKGVKSEDIDACSFETYIIDNHSYLPWLTKELQHMATTGLIKSVKFEKRRVLSLLEVFDEGFDLVINASGLASQYLLQDKSVVPIRGQYILKEVNEPVNLYYGGHTFMCPKPGRVALGSVYQVGRSDVAVDPNDTVDIEKRTSALCPAVRNGRTIGIYVGLRPGRYGGPRVELEWFKSRGNKREVPVIHNYGHGAKGILQHWGTSTEVARLSDSAIHILSRL